VDLVVITTVEAICSVTWRPYSFRLAVGVVLVAFTALADGIVALMLRPGFDYVLNPSVFRFDLAAGDISERFIRSISIAFFRPVSITCGLFLR